MDSGRGIMGQEWSGVVTLHLSPHNSKVKSHLKFTELDINASQACHFSEQYTDMKAYGSEWLPSLLSVSESVISQSE